MTRLEQSAVFGREIALVLTEVDWHGPQYLPENW